MVSGLGILAIGEQSKSPIVAAEADAHQALMLDSGAQAQRAEIAQVHAALRERAMELHHERLVLGTNGADRDRCSVLQFPLPDILRGVRTNCRARQALGGHAGVMYDDACVECQQMIGCSKQWIDVDFSDPWLLHHELAEADQQLL